MKQPIEKASCTFFWGKIDQRPIQKLFSGITKKASTLIGTIS